MKQQIISETDFCRLTNKQLTQKLIQLHSKGYDLDFCVIGNNWLVCVQNQERFPGETITVTVIDQVYDFITNSYKYVHIVDTTCGKKGIMVIEGIYGLYIRQAVMSASFN